MAVTSVASKNDRLPWLVEDQPRRKKRGGAWRRAVLGLLGMAAIAAIFYWTGLATSLQDRQKQMERTSAPAAVNPPAARSVEPIMPQVQPAPVPPQVALPMQDDVRPAVVESAPARPAPRRATHVRRVRAAATPAPPQTEAKRGLTFSDPWESRGASGRMVRVGTYSSLKQGKRAWSRLARVYPGMKRMPAVVTDIPSLRNGRVYYRLQIGTTSQAHSEVLCQRMRAIGQSCVVVDLAGARGKGKEDDGQPAGL